MGYRELYLEIVDVTCEENEVKGEDTPDTAKEYEGKADKSIEIKDLKLDYSQQRIYGIPPQNIQSGLQYQTRKVSAKEGDIISIGTKYNTKDEEKISEQDVIEGIEDEKGNQIYIKSFSNASHDFKVTENGEYIIFVKNESVYQLEVCGSIGVFKKEELEE